MIRNEASRQETKRLSKRTKEMRTNTHLTNHGLHSRSFDASDYRCFLAHPRKQLSPRVPIRGIWFSRDRLQCFLKGLVDGPERIEFVFA